MSLFLIVFVVCDCCVYLSLCVVDVVVCAMLLSVSVFVAVAIVGC